MDYNLIKKRLERSESDLQISKFYINRNNYSASIERSYFTVFNAMRAVLVLKDANFKSHKNTISYFNREFVKKGIFPKEFASKIENLRKLCVSYYPDITLSETLEQYNFAKRVVDEVNQYLLKMI